MAKIVRSKNHPIWIILIVFAGLVDLALLIRHFVDGKNIALFNPKGLIARQQHGLIMLIVVTLLMVAIPTLFMLYFTAWKYRETNLKAVHSPNAQSSKLFVFIMWLFPAIVIFSLGVGMWDATHKLAPQKTITSSVKPITIQVVTLRWKWLFIYPEQNIATVNFVQIPVDTPVRFELTADEVPMSSFWIPNLGGQLYSMTSHVNPLNLIADTPGDYPGSAAEINGAGFAGMKFVTRVSGAEDFKVWVDQVKQSPDVLNSTKYESILKPSEYNQAEYFSAFDSSLYDKVVGKYLGPSGGHGHNE